MAETLAKTVPMKNGRSGRVSTEVEPEGGSIGSEVFGRNETEQELVETYIKPAEFSAITSNGRQEAAEETLLEEPGSETGQEERLREAFFASYDVDETATEVIIGTDDRVRIANTTIYPYRAICALRITAADGTRWIGTGWLVGPRTVITAGHCVFLHGNGGWARSIEVIPGLNDAARPYGPAMGTALRSVKGWTEGKKREYDYGAIILPPNSRLGDIVGYFGYAVRDNNFLMGSVLNLSGYPGDKGGAQQWFMARTPKSLSDRVITYDIDTMGGQSGAPVWVKVGEQRYCVGIHTNGHISGNSATRIVQDVFNNIKNWKAEGA
ncbi:trypsin-like serine peptidase [uncultured Fibrella sp.]|uniref:trypsin-like serine peptidase n=1 Tax=uncultured Fibrella sp. TaxID=1284596 RepID=UPI0035C95EBC